MTSTWEILGLAERMGLKGAEFRAWYEERMAREREERAAERTAKKEMLELELRAKMEQLEVERRALEWRLEVAVAKGTQLEVQRREQAADVCSDSGFGGSELDFCKVSLEPRHRLSLEPGAQIEDGREVGGQGSRILAELDEAEDSFASMEQGSSIQSDRCFGTSEWPSTYQEEVRLPLNSSIEGAQKDRLGDDGECREVRFKVVAADSCVPRDAVTGAASMIGGHASKSLVERGSLNHQNSADATSSREKAENAESLLETRRTESRVRLSTSDVARQVGQTEQVNNVEPSAMSVEREPEESRVQGHFFLSSEKPDVSLAASFDAEDTSSNVLCLLDCQSEDGVRVRKDLVWTPLTRCACRQRLVFGLNPCCVVARNSAERPCVLVRGYRHAFQQTHFKATLPRLFLERLNDATRLVWDAIT